MSDWAPYVDVLRNGGVVACPTETWVGLLADALNQDAVQRVADIKGRASNAPIALLLPNRESLSAVAEPLSPAGRALVDDYWPGPLTIVGVAKPGLSPLLLQDGNVGARVPGPSAAAELTLAFGGPLTATSANRSDRCGESRTAR